MAHAHGWHLFKNLALAYLSLVLLPLSSIVVAIFCARNWLFASSIRHAPLPPSKRKTVLVTGVNMAKGLCLARHFHLKGHRVIGADTYRLSPGRVSVAIDKFYALPSPANHIDKGDAERDPYVLRLLDVVTREGVDLWISVSDVNAAVQDAVARDLIESRTKAKAAQLSLGDVQTLHEKDTFMQHAQSLGLPIPDTQVVQTRADIIDFLSRRGGLALKAGASRYLLKPIGVNDLARFNMPLLPLSTEDETLHRIDSIPLGRDSSFIMQEYIRGPEFCTHALVVRGRVRAFVACPSSELLMHYEALPSESPLSRKMLAFTETMAKAGGPAWTGHVSFDFLAKAESDGKMSHQVQMYPIECNPRVHTAVVLFNDTPTMVDEYLAILDDAPSSRKLLVPESPQRYYWIGQDLVERVVYPLCETLFLGALKPSQYVSSVASFGHHVVGWKDGTFETWDPLPWWWLHHVYWPLQFIAYIFRGRWHKINVSTGKAFKAT